MPAIGWVCWVFDEAFDTWKANKAKFDYGRDFDEWWQRDLSAMVLRDRNHPSIVFWSIGNEIPEVLVERGPAMARETGGPGAVARHQPPGIAGLPSRARQGSSPTR